MHDAPRYDPLEASDVLRRRPRRRARSWPTPSRAGSCARTSTSTPARSTASSPTTFPMPVTADGDGARPGALQRVLLAVPRPHRRRQRDDRAARLPRSRRRIHEERLRNAPVGYFFDVMTNGFGAMQDYAAQVPVADRWAIAAYIRALQLSQRATVADVPADRRAELDRPARRAGRRRPRRTRRAGEPVTVDTDLRAARRRPRRAAARGRSSPASSASSAARSGSSSTATTSSAPG